LGNHDSRTGEEGPDKLADLFPEAIDWIEEGHPAGPWIRLRSTCADVADHCRSLNRAR